MQDGGAVSSTAFCAVRLLWCWTVLLVSLQLGVLQLLLLFIFKCSSPLSRVILLMLLPLCML